MKSSLIIRNIKNQVIKFCSKVEAEMESTYDLLSSINVKKVEYNTNGKLDNASEKQSR